MLNTVEKQAWDEGIYTDWVREISRKGVGQKYDVSLSGKESRVSYYVSADYTRQQGIRKGDDYEKAGAMVKLDFNVTDWLTAGVKANYLASSSWGQTASLRHAMWMSPYSYVHSTVEGFTDWYNSKPDGSTASPYWGAGENDSHLWTNRSSKSNNLNAVAYAQIDFPFIKGLSYFKISRSPFFEISFVIVYYFLISIFITVFYEINI